MKRGIMHSLGFIYRRFLKKLLFCFNPESVHVSAIRFGERLGESRIARKTISGVTGIQYPELSQNVSGIHFSNPVGLAAGFDYEARLTRIAPCLGFGFETVGTITNMPCEGNDPPRLGRLVRSRSLMVNKGFRNPGIDCILEKFKNTEFSFPVGISIGQTNSAGIATIEQAQFDIVSAFEKAEQSQAPFSYYELNISCPNLRGNISFYDPEYFHSLLNAVCASNLTKPLWIKMPIDKSDHEIGSLLRVVSDHPVSAVIFGNLQKNKQDPSLVREEVMKFPKGNFSGKPTERRSNELIRLAYHFPGRTFAIIGCGGIFSAEDAYRKIRLGANLVELITGIVFDGPQLIGEINRGLAALLRRDGYASLGQAVGTLR